MNPLIPIAISIAVIGSLLLGKKTEGRPECTLEAITRWANDFAIPRWAFVPSLDQTDAFAMPESRGGTIEEAAFLEIVDEQIPLIVLDQCGVFVWDGSVEMGNWVHSPAMSEDLRGYQ